MLRQWEIYLSNSKYGTRTINAILPSFSRWLDRKHGRLEFHATQILTGHGCFGSYLEKIQKVDSPLCMACNKNVVDTVEHTLTQCSRWDEERNALTDVIGPDLQMNVLISKILETKEKWVAFATFCRRVMLTKENEERARQARRSRSLSLTIRNSSDNT